MDGSRRRNRTVAGVALLLMVLFGQVMDPTVHTPVDTQRGVAGLAFGEDYAKPLPTVGSADALVDFGLLLAGAAIAFAVLAATSPRPPLNAVSVLGRRHERAVPLPALAPRVLARRGPPRTA